MPPRREAISDPFAVLSIRRDMLRWLGGIAPEEWRFIAGQGIRFLAPPEAADLSGDRLIEHLVVAETTRVRKAELFHVDAATVRRAVAQVAAQPEEDTFTPEDMPAPYGLMVCEDSISRTEGGVPVIGVTWGVRDDGTVWTTWWSDAAYAARQWVEAGRMNAMVARGWLSQRSALQFEREQMLPFTAEKRGDPFAFPAMLDHSGAEEGREHVQRVTARITIALWRMIADQAVTVEVRSPAAAVARRMERDGLPAQIHAVRGPVDDGRQDGQQDGQAEDRRAAEVMAAHLPAGMLVPGRRYPRPLPPELARWYCYTTDGGHSIAVAVKALYRPGGDPAEFLMPAPVKAVQRVKWAVDDGFVVADLPYDAKLGLVTEPSDDEY